MLPRIHTRRGPPAISWFIKFINPLGSYIHHEAQLHQVLSQLSQGASPCKNLAVRPSKEVPFHIEKRHEKPRSVGKMTGISIGAQRKNARKQRKHHHQVNRCWMIYTICMYAFQFFKSDSLLTATALSDGCFWKQTPCIYLSPGLFASRLYLYLYMWTVLYLYSTALRCNVMSFNVMYVYRILRFIYVCHACYVALVVQLV